MAEEDIDARAEKTLKLFKNAQAEAETGILLWTMTAKELHRNNAELKQTITRHEATNTLLKQQIETLQFELSKTQRERDEIAGAKSHVDAEASSLLAIAQSSTHVMAEAMKKNRALKSEVHEALARLEGFQIYMAAAELREEQLEDEVASLKAAAAKFGDKVSDNGVKEVIHKPAPLQDHNTPERNPSTSQALQDKVESQRVLIEKQNRKYDRLLAKKESAEKKFFSSYVDWHDFKVWWTEFRKYPGVSQKVLEFNRETKRGQIPVSGRVLKVVEAAEKGGPDTFPSVAGEAELVKDDAPINAAESASSRLERAADIRQGWKDTIEMTMSQLEIGSTTALVTTAIEPLVPSGKDDPFDSEKTQETTPSKSQRPFQFDVTGISLPSVEWYSSSTKKPPSSVRAPTEPVPHFPAVTIKQEPQDDQEQSLLSNTKGGLRQGPTPFISSLGKRKAHQESTSDTGLEEDSLSDRSPLKVAIDKRRNPLQQRHVFPFAESSHARKRRVLNTEQSTKSPAAAAAEIMISTSKEKGKAPDGKTSLNSKYEINPDRNSGLNFAFDQTVRRKAERKKLDAGVCDCCKDYYEAVGPLPPRAQAPLWRSPKAGEERPLHKSRHCRNEKRRDGDSSSQEEGDGIENDAAIAAHRQEISRHRYHWRAPEDPPNYWNIGFPDTQEVADINRRAEKMHAQKEKMVEVEASKPNGKFRRR